MDTAPDARCFEFGGFRLDAAQRRLFAPDGAAIELPSRAFDVLLFMVERPGGLLDKSELLKAVWPTTVVEESNLSQCIFALRRALGDNPAEPRFIATVPSRGYQFIARVKRGSIQSGDDASASIGGDGHAPISNSQRRRAWLIGGAAVLLAFLGFLLWQRASEPTSAVAAPAAPDDPAHSKTIAVLPFADLSPARDMEYFSDGLAEELVNNLTKERELKVISRRSALTFKGSTDDVRDIGAQLRVANILEGSVRKEGDRLRISARLSRTSDGFNLWSETYDRKLDDVLDIQGAIAHEVVAALVPVMGSRDPRKRSEVLTRNPDAYAGYLRGLYLTARQDDTDMERTCNEFRHATELDPQFALAYARLARCYELMAYRTAGNFEQLRSLAHQAVKRALDLDPTLADLYWMHWFNERRNTLLTERAHRVERALALDPGDAEAMVSLGFAYVRLGRREDAYRMFESAYFADPLWPSSIYPLALSSYEWKGDRRRFVELLAQAERIAPDSPTPSGFLADLALVEGRALDWDRLVARRVALGPRELPVQGWLSLDYANLGETEAALHHARMCQRINPQSAAGWYNVAHIHLFAGDIAAARPVVQEVMKRLPSDFLALRARAELQYFSGDCAGSIESFVLAYPELGQPPAALDLVSEVASATMLTFCVRTQGNAARAAELAHAFETQFAPPTTAGVYEGTRARMAAALGDRAALIANLRALAKTRSLKFAFSPHEPMIRPYLNDPEIKPLLAALEARRAEWRRVLPKSSLQVPVPGIDDQAARSREMPRLASDVVSLR